MHREFELMPKPICVACRMEMNVEKIGVLVMLNAIRMTMRSGYKEEQVPYKAYHADLHKCPGCGVELISKSAAEPFWGAWMGTPAPKTDIVVPERTAEERLNA